MVDMPQIGAAYFTFTKREKTFTAGLRVFDITKPAEPREIGFMPVDGLDGRTTSERRGAASGWNIKPAAGTAGIGVEAAVACSADLPSWEKKVTAGQNVRYRLVYDKFIRLHSHLVYCY
jgi:hypothetical protein